MSLQPAKRTTPAKREARSRLRHLPLAAFAITTLALCLTSHHPARAHSCGPEPILNTLFNYSQLAERPDPGNTGEMTTCQYGSNGQTVSPDPLEEIDLTDHGRAGLIDNLEIRLRAYEDGAFIDVTDGALYVGCQQGWFETVKIAVELRLYNRTGKGDLIRPAVVGREGTNNEGEWIPLEVNDNVVSLPGTNWSWNTNTVLANLYGEKCAFPSAQFAVLAMCEQAHEGSDESDTASILTRGKTPTLVGHSLGATTAQFIMSALGVGMLPTCPRIEALAFSSIGLDPGYVALPPPVNRKLKSYVSECDWMAQLPGFHDEVQPGHLFVLSNTNSHLLNAVQDDLCRCLQGNCKKPPCRHG